jgi:hypothetical protein
VQHRLPPVAQYILFLWGKRIRVFLPGGNAAPILAKQLRKEDVTKSAVLNLPRDLSSHGLFALVLKKVGDHRHGVLAPLPATDTLQLQNTSR